MDESDEVIVGVLRELRSFLPRLVIIGGWVPELHRRWGGGQWRVEPARTIELDVLLMSDAAGEPPDPGALTEALREAGFRPIDEGGNGAVWERDVRRGERIEFFVDHRGPWRSAMAVRRLDDEVALGGVSLPDAAVLLEHRTELKIPLNEGGFPLSVWTPQIGIFLTHKGATFRRRSETVKAAKDLAYIVDVMRSGEPVVAEVERQIRGYCGDGGAAAALAGRVRNLVGLVIDEPGSTALRIALAAAIAERARLSPGAADALAIGALTDFVELIPEECGR
jgi:hypothetical protein